MHSARAVSNLSYLGFGLSEYAMNSHEKFRPKGPPWPVLIDSNITKLWHPISQPSVTWESFSCLRLLLILIAEDRHSLHSESDCCVAERCQCRSSIWDYHICRPRLCDFPRHGGCYCKRVTTDWSLDQHALTLLISVIRFDRIAKHPDPYVPID